MKCDNSYLLQLGIDEPLVNKAFEKKSFLKSYNEMNKSFINVGTCPLHIVHKSFQKAITTFDFNFDEFFCNIHFSSNSPVDEEKISKAWKISLTFLYDMLYTTLKQDG